ncbi:MAG: hypothetical protein IJH17_00615 [Clostridia bacterium]|nr:hypothetical protein [Clostridia bacterium]
MYREEMVFGVNDKDMRELIEFIKDVLEVEEGDEILVVNNVWRLTISKMPQYKAAHLSCFCVR